MRQALIVLLLSVMISLIGCGKAASDSRSEDTPQVDESTISKATLNGREYEEDSLIERDYDSELPLSETIVEVTATVVETMSGTQVSIPIRMSDLVLSGDKEVELVLTVQD
jgi:hypothetical protein